MKKRTTNFGSNCRDFSGQPQWRKAVPVPTRSSTGATRVSACHTIPAVSHETIVGESRLGSRPVALALRGGRPANLDLALLVCMPIARKARAGFQDPQTSAGETWPVNELYSPHPLPFTLSYTRHRYTQCHGYDVTLRLDRNHEEKIKCLEEVIAELRLLGCGLTPPPYPPLPLQQDKRF